MVNCESWPTNVKHDLPLNSITCMTNKTKHVSMLRFRVLECQSTGALEYWRTGVLGPRGPLSYRPTAGLQCYHAFTRYVSWVTDKGNALLR